MFRPTTIMLFLAAVVIATEACCKKSVHAGCVLYRNKRSTSDMVQNALTEFDVRLTEELSSEIQDMSPEEKLTFIQDLSKMNVAVKAEIASIDKNLPTDELLKQISDKVTQDFGRRKWFNRLRAVAGEKISQLIKEAGN